MRVCVLVSCLRPIDLCSGHRTPCRTAPHRAPPPPPGRPLPNPLCWAPQRSDRSWPCPLQIDHLTQSSEELQSELHERQKTVAKQVGRIHDLETALAVQTSQTEHLSKQTGHLISLLEALQEDVAEHQKTALRQANRVHELEVALAAQTSQRDHLARHADEQTNALEELRAELAAKQGTARRQALRMQELENAVAVQSSHMTVNDKPLQELQQVSVRA